MKILVTGGAGFIGSNLVKKLLDLGHQVITVDNFITGQKENVNKFKNNTKYKFFEHDITKTFPKSLDSSLLRLDAIYHLACPTGVDNLGPLAEEMILACSMGTKNVLEQVRKTKAKFLFTSSSEAYGDPQIFPQKEGYTGNVDPTGFRSPYEEGKRFSESLTLMYVRKYNIDAKIVRVFNTYGPQMANGDNRAIPIFLRQALKGEPITVHGKGLQTRTFCFVDDLVEGLITVMEKGTGGHVYNLGSNKEITITQLAELILRLSNSKSDLKFVKRPSHDHQSRLPNLEKVKKLGWTPKTDLEEGLVKTIQWLQ